MLNQHIYQALDLGKKHQPAVFDFSKLKLVCQSRLNRELTKNESKNLENYLSKKGVWMKNFEKYFKKFKKAGGKQKERFENHCSWLRLDASNFPINFPKASSSRSAPDRSVLNLSTSFADIAVSTATTLVAIGASMCDDEMDVDEQSVAVIDACTSPRYRTEVESMEIDDPDIFQTQLTPQITPTNPPTITPTPPIVSSGAAPSSTPLGSSGLSEFSALAGNLENSCVNGGRRLGAGRKKVSYEDASKRTRRERIQKLRNAMLALSEDEPQFLLRAVIGLPKFDKTLRQDIISVLEKHNTSCFDPLKAVAVFLVRMGFTKSLYQTIRNFLVDMNMKNLIPPYNHLRCL